MKLFSRSKCHRDDLHFSSTESAIFYITYGCFLEKQTSGKSYFPFDLFIISLLHRRDREIIHIDVTQVADNICYLTNFFDLTDQNLIGLLKLNILPFVFTPQPLRISLVL